MKTIADKIRGGIAGKILRVNLDSGEITTEDTEKYAKRFIGGRVINSFILLNEVDPKTKWSDAENMVIFGTGALGGTLAPGACRLTIDSINVFSNGKGSTNCGGNFAPELKFAGFDHVVITGKAKKPVYLWIHDGTAELRDASSIWGKTTFETERILQEELGDEAIEVAAIGPAGENLVRGAGVIVDCARACCGSGIGCILGDKKLKAIAVRGHGAVKVAEPERFMRAVDTARKKAIEAPFLLNWRKGIIGSGLWLPDSPAWDLYAVGRNGQDDYWPMEKRERLFNKDTGVPKYAGRSVACFSCPAGCNVFSEIPSGKYKDTRGLGYWINSSWWSEFLDIDDPEASLKYHNMCSQLGMDGDNSAVVLAWAFECYERGLITKEDTGGLELEWGNVDTVLELLSQLVYRQGFGNFLADGVKAASEKLGKGSEKFALHMKGQDTLDPYRIVKGWGLGVSTSPVAGRHLRGAIGPGVGPKEVSFSPTEYENMPQLHFWEIRAKEIEDMTGICNYITSYFGIYALEITDIAALANAALGINLTAEDYMLIGRRAYNLEKAFNTIRTELNRKDDLPPKRYREEPVKSGPYKGYKCDEDKWNEMLDEFYELNSWDKVTGWQTRKCLMELDMEDVAEKLEKAGKLIR